MDTGHVKFPLTDDPEMQAIDKRRELLAAYRLVRRDMLSTMTMQAHNNMDTSEALQVAERFAEGRIEQLEQAE